MRQLTLITPRFPPECCGVGDHTEKLAQAIQQRGAEVVVLTGPAPGPRPEGLRVLETPMRGWRDLPALLRVVRVLGTGRVQIEYSSYAWSRWGFAWWVNALVAALRLRGMQVTVGLHELPIRLRQHPKLVALGLLQRVHFWLLCLTATRVLTNTQSQVQRIRRWLPWRSSRILYRPNSSAIPFSAATPEQLAGVRAGLGARPETIVVAMFGMFHAGKNYEAGVEAVAALREHFDVQLWMMGNTKMANAQSIAKLRRAAWRLGIQDRCVWTGHADAVTLSHRLQAADIFLLTQPGGLTRSSAFMAAAAQGIPVVAVRDPGSQAEFTHGKNIWLVEHSSAEEFAGAIATLARDAGLRRQLGAELQRLYRSRFDWQVTSAIGLDPETIEHSPAIPALKEPARR